MTDPFYSVASPPDFDKPVRVLIAVSCHDRHVAELMVQTAQAVLHAHPIDVDVIEVERVDELPSALALSARMSQFDGLWRFALCHWIRWPWGRCGTSWGSGRCRGI